MSFDLTNKNISDTFQNLLQRTGSDNRLYDLEGNEVTNLRINGTLTADQYVVSSSVTNVTFQQQSGSTIFGDSSDDTHLFTGNITASGNISASGTIIGSNISGTNTGDQDLSGLALKTEVSGAFTSDSASFSTRIAANEVITARTLVSSSAQIASDISGSFTATSSSLSTRLATAESELNNTLISSSLQFDSSDNVTFNNITASGDISASGNGSFTGTLRADGNVDFNGDLDVDGTTNLDAVDIDDHITIANNKEIKQEDSSGTGRTIIELDSSNDLNIGGSYAGSLKIIGGGSYAEVARFDDDGHFVQVSGKNITTNEITASGNISGSGFVSANAASGFFWGTDSTTAIYSDGANSVTVKTNDEDTFQIGTYGVNVPFGNVTASGVISASGNILTSGNIIMVSPNQLKLNGDLADDRIFYSADNGINIDSNEGTCIYNKLKVDTLSDSGKSLTVGGDISSSGDIFNTVNVQMTNSSSVINTFNTGSHQTCKYTLEVTSGSHIQSSEMLVVQNSSNAFNTEYAQINSSVNLLDFTSKVNGSNVELIGSSSFISCSVKFVRTLI